MSAEIIPARTPAEVFLASAFERSKATLPGNAKVAKWREDTFRRFYAAGLPHRRIEAWHYTDLRSLMREALPVATPPDETAIAALRETFAADAPALRLVLVDGFFAGGLSTPMPDGIRVASLASVLSEGRLELIALLASQDLGGEDPIVALNAALMQDGIIIEVADGTQVAEPIHLIHVTASPTAAAHFSRSAVIVGAGAAIRLAESCHSASPVAKACASQVNACLTVSVGDNARLAHTAMVTGHSPHGVRLETMLARVGQRAKFDSFALVSGIGLVRRQTFLRFEGAGAEASFGGASLLGGREHADTTLLVEHMAPACRSRETYKYILDEEATGIFQGKIHVAPKAQKTDGKMLSRAVLLSDMAAMNNKPELEIFADDVVCGHGATCGGLDADQLFYLQTRGLPLPEAEALLLEAFAGELIDGIGDDGLIHEFRGQLRIWLAARRHAAKAANDQMERA
ncbi:Fe-S cluster assembly protein SufD [Methylocapsa sp. D3K7]|uniref:Fe-S cluster assembly protein SufD n=1 Tax=Methylocapsa sp. D3K7 TaxID=3041435 RepID=UPI00244EACF1|nr:Fe-S cluster assembly protein SufD [Methylocapsa sp. D3K7]WGJ15494.1 Fe-S cluster assembly protein SufD [Methylocapsa sp. D3K7]